MAFMPRDRSASRCLWLATAVASGASPRCFSLDPRRHASKPVARMEWTRLGSRPRVARVGCKLVTLKQEGQDSRLTNAAIARPCDASKRVCSPAGASGL